MTQTEQVARLAELLQALKDRTDRSYEALAKRIGVSSSSLHRYCRGECVPSSYEVIGRFGRACGVGREEANELLQSWALAASRAHQHNRVGHDLFAPGTAVDARAMPASGTVSVERERQRRFRRLAAVLVITGIAGGTAGRFLGRARFGRPR